MRRTSSITDMPWDELGSLLHGMSFALRPMHAATRDITARYALGPRGAWILVLIDNGHVYPLDITNVFRIGRSLISSELARLTEAGLITAVRSAQDGRRTQLTLTLLGVETCRQVRDQLRSLVTERLGSYSREQLMLCAQMLRDFREPATD